MRLSHQQQWDCWQRLGVELEVLQAIYSEPGEIQVDSDIDLLSVLVSIAKIEAGEGQPLDSDQSEVAELREILDPHDFDLSSVSEFGELVEFLQTLLPLELSLTFTFFAFGVATKLLIPAGYPEFHGNQPPHVVDVFRLKDRTQSSDSADRTMSRTLLSVTNAQRHRFLEGLEPILSERIGESSNECLLELVDATRDHAEVFGRSLEEEVESSSKPSEPIATEGPLVLKRCVLWFHHIKSPTKRRHIVQWSSELRLGGFSKPGYPGVVIVEGEKADVDTYVRRLQSLRWKAIAVRGEEEEEVGGEAENRDSRSAEIDRRRRLPKEFEEVHEQGGMSVISQACTAAGVEGLFLTAMKIRR